MNELFANGKFCHHFSEFDAWEVESYGYKHAKLSTKLRILKHLLECQFDFNLKFKEKVNESQAEDMRFLPIGRDKDGQAYWYFLDKELNLLVYREEQDDQDADTWQLVCRDRQQLATLVKCLQTNATKVKEEDEKSSSSGSRSSKEGSPDKQIIEMDAITEEAMKIKKQALVRLERTLLPHSGVVKQEKDDQVLGVSPVNTNNSCLPLGVVDKTENDSSVSNYKSEIPIESSAEKDSSAPCTSKENASEAVSQENVLCNSVDSETHGKTGNCPAADEPVLKETSVNGSRNPNPSTLQCKTQIEPKVPLESTENHLSEGQKELNTKAVKSRVSDNTATDSCLPSSEQSEKDDSSLSRSQGHIGTPDSLRMGWSEQSAVSTKLSSGDNVSESHKQELEACEKLKTSNLSKDPPDKHLTTEAKVELIPNEEVEVRPSSVVNISEGNSLNRSIVDENNGPEPKDVGPVLNKETLNSITDGEGKGEVGKNEQITNVEMKSNGEVANFMNSQDTSGTEVADSVQAPLTLASKPKDELKSPPAMSVEKNAERLAEASHLPEKGLGGVSTVIPLPTSVLNGHKSQGENDTKGKALNIGASSGLDSKIDTSNTKESVTLDKEEISEANTSVLDNTDHTQTSEAKENDADKKDTTASVHSKVDNMKTDEAGHSQPDIAEAVAMVEGKADKEICFADKKEKLLAADNELVKKQEASDIDNNSKDVASDVATGGMANDGCSEDSKGTVADNTDTEAMVDCKADEMASGSKDAMANDTDTNVTVEYKVDETAVGSKHALPIKTDTNSMVECNADEMSAASQDAMADKTEEKTMAECNADEIASGSKGDMVVDTATTALVECSDDETASMVAADSNRDKKCTDYSASNKTEDESRITPDYKADTRAISSDGVTPMSPANKSKLSVTDITEVSADRKDDTDVSDGKMNCSVTVIVEGNSEASEPKGICTENISDRNTSSSTQDSCSPLESQDKVLIKGSQVSSETSRSQEKRQESADSVSTLLGDLSESEKAVNRAGNGTLVKGVSEIVSNTESTGTVSAEDLHVQASSLAEKSEKAVNEKTDQISTGREMMKSADSGTTVTDETQKNVQTASDNNKAGKLEESSTVPEPSEGQANATLVINAEGDVKFKCSPKNADLQVSGKSIDDNKESMGTVHLMSSVKTSGVCNILTNPENSADEEREVTTEPTRETDEGVLQKQANATTEIDTQIKCSTNTVKAKDIPTKCADNYVETTDNAPSKSVGQAMAETVSAKTGDSIVDAIGDAPSYCGNKTTKVGLPGMSSHDPSKRKEDAVIEFASATDRVVSAESACDTSITLGDVVTKSADTVKGDTPKGSVSINSTADAPESGSDVSEQSSTEPTKVVSDDAMKIGHTDVVNDAPTNTASAVVTVKEDVLIASVGDSVRVVDDLTKAADVEMKTKDEPPKSADDSVLANDVPTNSADVKVKDVPTKSADETVKTKGVPTLIADVNAKASEDVSTKSDDDTMKVEDAVSKASSNDTTKVNDVAPTEIAETVKTKGDATTKLAEIVRAKDDKPTASTDVQAKDDISTKSTDDTVRTKGDLSTISTDDPIKAKDVIPTKPTDDDLRSKDDIPTKPTDDALHTKDDIPSKPTDDALHVKDDIPTKPTDDALHAKDDIPTKPTDDSRQAKDDVPTKPTDDAVQAKDDIPTKSDVDIKAKDDIPAKSTDDAIKTKDDIPSKSADVDIKTKDVIPTKSDVDIKAKDDIPSTSTDVATKTKDDIPSKSADVDIKTKDDIPTKSDVDIKAKDNIPSKSTDVATKTKYDIPSKSADVDIKTKDDILTKSVDVDVKIKDDIPVKSTDVDVKSKDDIPTKSTDDAIKTKDIPTKSADDADKVKDISTKSTDDAVEAKDDISTKSAVNAMEAEDVFRTKSDIIGTKDALPKKSSEDTLEKKSTKSADKNADDDIVRESTDNIDKESVVGVKSSESATEGNIHGKEVSETPHQTPGEKSLDGDSQRKLKRAAPEPASDEMPDSEPNGKRARPTAKLQRSRGGRNATARGRAALLAQRAGTESDDSEAQLGQVTPRGRGRGRGKGRRGRGQARKVVRSGPADQQEEIIEAKSKPNTDREDNEEEEKTKLGTGEEDEGASDNTAGKRTKKKKAGSSTEALSEEEVTPAKKGRNQVQQASKQRGGKRGGKSWVKPAAAKTTAAVKEDETGGRRRSVRVREMKAKRPPTPPSPSSHTEESLEDTEEDSDDEDVKHVLDQDQDYLAGSFTPDEESGNEDFKPKGRNFQRQAERIIKKENEEVVNDDTPCVKCEKFNHPEMILLCDKCDAGYHTACLRPPLMVIPDGDWFCPPCEHSMLVDRLLECLQTLDVASKKKDRLTKRQERLAFVGISISNILHGERKISLAKSFDDDGGENDVGQKEEEKVQELPEEASVGSSSSYESEPELKRTYRSERLATRQAEKRSRREKSRNKRSSHTRRSPEVKPFAKRACRTRSTVSYQFKEFDELISNAIEDDKPLRREKPPGISRGKDMSNILGASDEEEEKIRLRDGLEEPPPVVKRKPKRRLTTLESDEEGEEEDEEESEEFKLSDEEDSDATEVEGEEEEDEGDEEEELNSDSGDWRPKKTWFNSRATSRRTATKRARNFVVDDDEYDSDENASKRRSTRNSTRGRVRYNDWASDDTEVETEDEEEASFSDFSSDDSKFARKMKREKEKHQSAGAKKKRASSKKDSENEDDADSAGSHSDSSLTRRRKLLKKLVKKRRKDNSDSEDSEVDKAKARKGIQKSAGRTKKMSHTDGSDFSLDGAGPSDYDSEEGPRFKKKNVLRSSEEESGEDEQEEPVAAQAIGAEGMEGTVTKDTVKNQEKGEVDGEGDSGLSPITLKISRTQGKNTYDATTKPVSKGKKRGDKAEVEQVTEAVQGGEFPTPGKMRRVSGSDHEQDEGTGPVMGLLPAGKKVAMPTRRSRRASTEAQALSEKVELSVPLGRATGPHVKNVMEKTTKSGKKKKIPNFLDVPSGEESEEGGLGDQHKSVGGPPVPLSQPVDVSVAHPSQPAQTVCETTSSVSHSRAQYAGQGYPQFPGPQGGAPGQQQQQQQQQQQHHYGGYPHPQHAQHPRPPVSGGHPMAMYPPRQVGSPPHAVGHHSRADMGSPPQGTPQSMLTNPDMMQGHRMPQGCPPMRPLYPGYPGAGPRMDMAHMGGQNLEPGQVPTRGHGLPAHTQAMGSYPASGPPSGQRPPMAPDSQHNNTMGPRAVHGMMRPYHQGAPNSGPSGDFPPHNMTPGHRGAGPGVMNQPYPNMRSPPPPHSQYMKQYPCPPSSMSSPLTSMGQMAHCLGDRRGLQSPPQGERRPALASPPQPEVRPESLPEDLSSQSSDISEGPAAAEKSSLREVGGKKRSVSNKKVMGKGQPIQSHAMNQKSPGVMNSSLSPQQSSSAPSPAGATAPPLAPGQNTSPNMGSYPGPYQYPNARYNVPPGMSPYASPYPGHHGLPPHHGYFLSPGQMGPARAHNQSVPTSSSNPQPSTLPSSGQKVPSEKVSKKLSDSEGEMPAASVKPEPFSSPKHSSSLPAADGLNKPSSKTNTGKQNEGSSPRGGPSLPPYQQGQSMMPCQQGPNMSPSQLRSNMPANSQSPCVLPPSQPGHPSQQGPNMPSTQQISNMPTDQRNMVPGPQPGPIQQGPNATPIQHGPGMPYYNPYFPPYGAGREQPMTAHGWAASTRPNFGPMEYSYRRPMKPVGQRPEMHAYPPVSTMPPQMGAQESSAASGQTSEGRFSRRVSTDSQLSQEEGSRSGEVAARPVVSPPGSSSEASHLPASINPTVTGTSAASTLPPKVEPYTTMTLGQEGNKPLKSASASPVTSPGTMPLSQPASAPSGPPQQSGWSDPHMQYSNTGQWAPSTGGGNYGHYGSSPMMAAQPPYMMSGGAAQHREGDSNARQMAHSGQVGPGPRHPGLHGQMGGGQVPPGAAGRPFLPSHYPGYNRNVEPHAQSGFSQDIPAGHQGLREMGSSGESSQASGEHTGEANSVSKPKRAKTQKKSGKEMPGGRGRAPKGRGRGRGGFMIDNLLKSKGEDDGEDSSEMKDIVSYITTDEFFKQQTST